jgi:hypothetical protein
MSCDARTNAAITLALDWLIWAALASAALSVVFGVIALATRSDRIARTVVGMSSALVVGTLVVIPGALGSYVCGSATPW